jgi:alpha-galactosidase
MTNDKFNFSEQAEAKKTMKKIALTLLLLGLAASLAPAGDPAFYVRKATWNETLLASLEAYDAAAQSAARSLDVAEGPWSTIGPFVGRDAFAESFGPEKAPAMRPTVESDGKAWIVKPDWIDDAIIPLPTVDRSANYMWRELTAVRSGPVTGYFGSDDGIKIWLNGKLLLEHDAPRGCARNQEIVPLLLEKGSNALLVKVSNGNGPTAFYFSLIDLDPAPIWALLRRDFPGSLEEIDQESDDGIWQGPVHAGEYDAIGQRYAGRRTALAAEIGRLAAVGPVRIGSVNELWSLRRSYVDAHRARREFYREQAKQLTLTPKPGPGPRINGPKVFGVRPNHPVLYRIPATGTRPMEFGASGLPPGLAIDPKTGQISGAVATPGEYAITLRASNAAGTAERALKLEVGDRIALTPPLGWNSWNCFATDVDDVKVRAAADAMVSSGLSEHGWSYINIDDCWEIKGGSNDPIIGGEPRHPDGTIRVNRKFPDMKALGDYVHGLGLRIGIYSSPGPLTCGGYTASWQHELQDAMQYAAWGIDYLKYDWCSYDGIAKDRSLPELKKPYAVMRAALDRADRDIVFSLCQYGMGDVWTWGAEVGGNCWRTTGDITDTWESLSGIGFSQDGHEKYAGPGHWNDPDMLVVGYVGWGPSLHPTRLTPLEQMTHITLWSLLSSPLLIGCDMTRLDEFTLSLLTNDEVLAVNQDPLGKPAGRVAKDGSGQVWARTLEDGSRAVGLFNLGENAATVRVRWADIGLSGKHAVRDLWRQKDLGSFDGYYEVEVGRHGAALIQVR